MNDELRALQIEETINRIHEKLIELATRNGIDFDVDCLPEESSIEGNCSCIDEETDKATEQEIRTQLADGNDWAWCTVKVTATYEGFKGHDYLGCCSYASLGDFKVCGYYKDMKKQALYDLAGEIYEASRKLNEVQEVLR